MTAAVGSITAHKDIKLIEIDNNLVIVHDDSCGKDEFYNLILLPTTAPGYSIQEMQSKIESFAKANHIPVRRRPHI